MQMLNQAMLTTVFCKGMRTTANTIHFRDCLKQHNMCLPSTLAIHSGSRDTWTMPDGGDTFCIGYVAVPSTWKAHCTWSQVLEAFDLATSREDHKVVGLELTWWQRYYHHLPPHHQQGLHRCRMVSSWGTTKNTRVVAGLAHSSLEHGR
jgi:hypothetical protein